MGAKKSSALVAQEGWKQMGSNSVLSQIIVVVLGVVLQPVIARIKRAIIIFCI